VTAGPANRFGPHKTARNQYLTAEIGLGPLATQTDSTIRGAGPSTAAALPRTVALASSKSCFAMWNYFTLQRNNVHHMKKHGFVIRKVHTKWLIHNEIIMCLI